MAETDEKIARLYELFLESSGVCTDTRKIFANSLFFALKGASFNGNNFAVKALELGAAYAVIDEPSVMEGLTEELKQRLFLVEDVLTALQALARHHRLKLRIPVIGLTGTNGKTTTKELIAAVLRKRYNVLATEGNLNNHIGVPLTLLKMTHETQVAVIEMGASALGEIKTLVEIVSPSFGLITSIGKAHLQGFGSLEGVMKTKGELFDYLLAHRRIAFVNSDNKYIREIAAARPELHYVVYGRINDRAKVIENSPGDPFLSMVVPNPLYGYSEGTRISPSPTPEETKDRASVIKTHLIGDYNADNVLAALSVGTYFGITHAQAIDAIEGYTPVNNRSQMISGKSNTLIIDAYNANPTSMRASIENFAKLHFDNKALLLGDMLELGESSVEEHKAIIELALSMNPVKIILVGEEFAKAAQKLGCGSKFNAQVLLFKNVGQIIEAQQNSVILENCAILVKGSHGIHLEKVAEEKIF